MRPAIPAAVIGPATVVLLTIGAAQTGRIPTPRDFGDERPWGLGPETPTERHEFTFARAAYSGMGRGWGRGRGS